MLWNPKNCVLLMFLLFKRRYFQSPGVSFRGFIFVLQHWKNMTPLDFPASLGEDVFFYRVTYLYYMATGDLKWEMFSDHPSSRLLRLLTNHHNSYKTLNLVYSIVHQLWFRWVQWLDFQSFDHMEFVMGLYYSIGTIHGKPGISTYE